MRLEELAEISVGYSFRSSVSEFQNNHGNVLLVQATDLSSQDLYVNNESSLRRIALKNIRLGSELLLGDVLFAYRGNTQSKLKASVFNIRSNAPIIASSTLYVIRPNIERVLPEYLAIYLNSDKGQKMLQSLSTGSVVRAIPIKELKTLSIPIPDKEKQEAIIALWKNIQKQNSILRRRIQLQEKFVNDFTSILTKSH